MDLNKTSTKQLLGTFSNQKKLHSTTFYYHLNNSKLQFNIEDLIPFEDFKTHITNSNYIYLQKELVFTKSLISYKSPDGLKLFVHESPNHIAIIALGEYQPSLYKIYIEGIFSK